jgi:hypothetical protein
VVKMNNIAKSAIVAVTPTVTILHGKWIAFLIGVNWSEVHPILPFGFALTATAIAATVLFAP